MKTKSFSVFELGYEYKEQMQKALVVRPKKKPAPAVLYLHGYHGSTWSALSRARALQKGGYVVYVAPLLGLGNSKGVPDFNGPETRAMLAPVIEEMLRDESIDSARIALWGVGRGAHLAATLISESHTFKAAVLESGMYDLEKLYSDSQATDNTKNILEKECGADAETLRARSPIHGVHSIYCPVLLLFEASDSETHVSQAQEYAEALERAAVPHETYAIENTDGDDDINIRKKYVTPFLESRLHVEKSESGTEANS